MADPAPLVDFLLLWSACIWLRRTHAILGRTRKDLREREPSLAEDTTQAAETKKKVNCTSYNTTFSIALKIYKE